MSNIVVENNTYNIQSTGNPSSVANLVGGNPNAAITGYALAGNLYSPDLQWVVTNFGDVGDQITIENVAAQGYYASAYNYSQDAPLIGSQNATIWTVTQVTPGNYRIEANGYEWNLGGSADNVAILLSQSSGNDPLPQQQWSFVKVTKSS